MFLFIIVMKFTFNLYLIVIISFMSTFLLSSFSLLLLSFILYYTILYYTIVSVIVIIYYCHEFHYLVIYYCHYFIYKYFLIISSIVIAMIHSNDDTNTGPGVVACTYDPAKFSKFFENFTCFIINMTSILSFFECITSSSLISLEGVKFIVNINAIFHVLDL